MFFCCLFLSIWNNKCTANGILGIRQVWIEGRGGEEMREAREFIFKSFFVKEVIINFKSSIFVMELNIIIVTEEIIGAQAYMKD